MSTHHKYIFTLAIVLVFIYPGCKKFIEVPAPANTTATSIVFNSEETAIAEVTGIYSVMSKGFPNGYVDVSIRPELSADNLTLFATNTQTYLPFYKNELTPNYVGTSVYLWTGSYQLIYSANAAIEGLSSSTKLNTTVKNQLLGEAYFMRGFFYFYLVNLFGDVPLALTTDYTQTEKLSRSPQKSVYEQIISDLKNAEEKLSVDYLDATLLHPTSERVRPNKSTASAMLARTYLFMGDYANAELYASKVINNSAYSLIDPSLVFLKNSNETVWALQPVVNGQNTKEGLFYTLPSSGPNGFSQPVYLSSDFLNNFEPNDLRATDWTNTITVGNTAYTYPTKYKAGNFPINNPPTPQTEYSIVIRLAELHLIRAEARAQLGNVSDAQNDLNQIRQRAKLGNTTANTKAGLLSAIFKERRMEFFTEWANRWLDLKRSGKINEVMSVITPLKGGGGWKPEFQFYPIPQAERNANPSLTQNPGYAQ